MELYSGGDTSLKDISSTPRELYSAVLMLELLTKENRKEYIVASILAWYKQTLYFLFKVRRGHVIKKQNNLLSTVRQT